MMRLVLVAALVACGGNAVREAHPPLPETTPPPPPMPIDDVCAGATGWTDYDVPESMCPLMVVRSCDCATGLFFIFCKNPYYYDFDQREWLRLCPP